MTDRSPARHAPARVGSSRWAARVSRRNGRRLERLTEVREDLAEGVQAR